MKFICRLMTATVFLQCAGLAVAQDVAPRHELGLTLGSIQGSSRSAGNTKVELGRGTALQANYGLRLPSGKTAAIYGEVHFLANGQRAIERSSPFLTRDVATAYVTPGIRVKFRPQGAVAPYVAVGGGYALYEQSLLIGSGAPNPAPRFRHRGAFMFGGGVDAKLWRFVGLRAEIRDFYSGSPDYNASAIRGGQHNVVVGGGFVLRFR